MTRTVFLVRHGHHAEVGHILSGRSPIPLDGRGEAEAARLSDHFAAVPVNAIHASPQVRAQQTAAPAAARLGLPVTTAGALDEVDFGEWTGSSFDALDPDPRWRAWNAARATAPAAAGETMRQAVDRARSFLDALGPGSAMCVTHCDIIRGVVADYLGMSLDHLLRLGCDPGSVTTLVLHDGGAQLVALNERPA